ncbi:MAG: SDR family oxidoreductase [Bauldia sp.]|nr:SDR family oxidoreductase [Bauldia sp.]
MPVAFDFAGRVAVVTGGSNGIGRAIVERLRDAGAAVIVWDLVEPAYPGVSFAEVDVTDAASIGRAVSALSGAHPAVDILVNNAGIVGESAPVLGFDPDRWRRIVDVNLFGTFEVCRQVVPLMQRNGYGRVVNMASLAGKNGTPLVSAYAAAKAGIIAFTKSFGKELAETDIRVNCIAPAAVATEILGQMAEEVVQGMIDASPAKRLGTVDEVADIALFLCSEACSFNIGATFDVSGGRAVY